MEHLGGAYSEAEEKLVRMLVAIEERLRDEGRTRPLRLEPGELARMGDGTGLDGAEAAELFRRLVQGNYVRLRGRFREGATGRSAPAYVAGLTDRGLRELGREAGPNRGIPGP